MKLASISIFTRGSYTLLSWKKKGFLSGFRVAAGGKFAMEKGDKTMEDCSIREVYEEHGVTVSPEDQKLVAIVDFFERKIWTFRCYVYLVRRWKGKIKATEELQRAQVFRVDRMPWPSMPADKKSWLPLVFEGEKAHFEIYQTHLRDDHPRVVRVCSLEAALDTMKRLESVLRA